MLRHRACGGGLTPKIVENVGQFAAPVHFVVLGGRLRAGLLVNGFHCRLSAPLAAESVERLKWEVPTEADAARVADVQLRFEGTDPGCRLQVEEPELAYANYFFGSDPARWKTRVPTCSAVRYVGLYPGIDVVVRHQRGGFEYDLVLAPWADLARVRIRVEGGAGSRIDAEGRLVIDTAVGPLAHAVPQSFEVGEDGERTRTLVRMEQVGDGVFGFQHGARREGKWLVIDPEVQQPSFFSYLGHDHAEWALDVTAVAGRLTVTGTTISADFPTTAQPPAGVPYQKDKLGSYDVFISKFSPDGNSLLWSTFVGTDVNSPEVNSQGDFDIGRGIDVDAQGNAYICGYTSNNGGFPAVNAFQASGNAVVGNFIGDGFVLKINNTGTSLLYSTYLGGSNLDSAEDIAVDPFGNAFVCGWTRSLFSTGGETGFPTTAGAFLPAPAAPVTAGESAFVTKFSPAGNTLIWSSLLDSLTSPGGVQAYSISLESDAVAPDKIRPYIAGISLSINGFPATATAVPVAGANNTNGFVAGFTDTGASLYYASLLGGNNFDQATSCSITDDGKIVVVGQTSSTNFPLLGAFQTAKAAADDAFVMRIDPSPTVSSSLLFSSYLGGSGSEHRPSVATDGAGSAYCVLETESTTGLPITAACFLPASPPAAASELGLFKIRGSTVTLGMYMGGSARDMGFSVAVKQGVLYIAGGTASQDFYSSLNYFMSFCGWSALGGAYHTNSGNIQPIMSFNAFAPQPPDDLEVTPAGLDAFVLKLMAP